MSKLIAVVGLGAMGSMTAWRLSSAGADVTGFDLFAPPHDHGAHAGESRMFRAAYLEGPEYVPYLMRARQGWTDLQAAAGQQLFHEAGILSVGRPDDAFLAQTAHAASVNQLPFQRMDPEELGRALPQFTLRGNEIGLLDTMGGLIEPERAVGAALDQAARNGARFVLNSRVTAVEEKDGRPRLLVDDEWSTFDHIVVTAGAWSASLLEDTFADVVPNQLYLAWFLSSEAAAFGPERFPGTILKADGMDDLPLGICIFPSLDGKWVKVGETIGGSDPLPSPEGIDRFIDPHRLQRLSECVQEYLPSLRPHPTRVGTYVDGFVPDTRPRMVATQGITALAGFSGHGFKFSPLVGEIAAKAALDGDTKDGEAMFAMQFQL